MKDLNELKNLLLSQDIEFNQILAGAEEEEDLGIKKGSVISLEFPSPTLGLIELSSLTLENDWDVAEWVKSIITDADLSMWVISIWRTEKGEVELETEISMDRCALLVNVDRQVILIYQ